MIGNGEAVILLDQRLIQSYIKQLYGFEINNIKIHHSISSTIDYLSKQGIIEGELAICLAEHQTQGRGRLGRTWYSPFAANIYLSLAWLSKCEFSTLAKLNLVVGLATIKVLERLGVIAGLQIKWPNDILWQGRKLAGIIMTADAPINGLSRIIISVGLNVNMTKDSELLRGNVINQAWVSLRQIINSYQDRNIIVAMLIVAIYEALMEIEKTGENKILEQWVNYDALYGQIIRLKSKDKIIQGEGAGINKNGHLLVRDNCGLVKSYVVGEVDFCRVGGGYKFPE